mmetsp:Transcript_10889/g.12339  ORF Transcript_10889/g.12339 Transcript_10889/m.12339 type:complete len:211 (-) Transcript_10889:258-890(-)
MEKYSAVNTLSSFETEGLPADFFVDGSESQQEIEQHENSFKIHRKLLRRRHVRKIQKVQERQQHQQQKEKEETQMMTERQLRAEEKEKEEEIQTLLRQSETFHRRNNGRKRTMGTCDEVSNPTAESAQLAYYRDYYNFIGETTTKSTSTNNNISYLPSWRIVFTPTKSPMSSHNIALHKSESAAAPSRHVSYTLPEFSPVRSSKFRKLQF